MPRKLTVGSCFSGIGGLELGLEWTGGFETKWQIENDPYASSVLEKHWPHVRRYGDIRSVDPELLEQVELICGGYPCQPFSLAGQRRGGEDDRNLWPDMFGIICVVRPKYVLLENVPGHLSLGFGRVLGDLASLGYDAEWQVLHAANVGAPHIRQRLFIVAYATSERMEKRRASACRSPKRQSMPSLRDRAMAQWEKPWTEVCPSLCRMDDGIPNRIRRGFALGNAVVPHVAQKVGEMILQREIFK